MTRILVPVDGSDLSEAALPVAEELAKGLAAEVVLLSVGPPPETTPQAEEERADLQQIVDRAASRLSGVDVRTRIDTGRDPVHGILEAVDEEDIDYVVMSTHGRSGLAEVAEGSVAREVIRAGRVPVMLVRPRLAA